MNAADFNRWLAGGAPRTLVMGILNVTPDSFSDKGRFLHRDDALARAREMIAQGVDILDIGGESTRPGAARISAREQIARIMPVIEAVRRESDILFSVDTTLSEVAKEAAEGGAIILNDISAGREDPAMFALAAERGFPIILMHMKGEPATMQDNPQYGHVTREVAQFLQSRAQAAMDAQVPRERILLDPGIGFGKTTEHNLQLLRELPHICQLGFPVLIGTSRKRFIGAITGESDPADRVIGSCVSASLAIERGARIVRAHDVAQTIQAVKITEAIMGL